MHFLAKVAFLSLLSTSALAQVPVVSCAFEMESWLEGAGLVKSKTEVFLKGTKYVARITNELEGETAVLEEKVAFSRHKVRAGLKGNLEGLESERLNFGEALVVHAMTLASDPTLGGVYSAGLRLKDIRAVKVYALGEKTNMGQSAIVVAENAKGKGMGSFMGGFLLAACKR